MNNTKRSYAARCMALPESTLVDYRLDADSRHITYECAEYVTIYYSYCTREYTIFRNDYYLDGYIVKRCATLPEALSYVKDHYPNAREIVKSVNYDNIP